MTNFDLPSYHFISLNGKSQHYEIDLDETKGNFTLYVMELTLVLRLQKGKLRATEIPDVHSEHPWLPVMENGRFICPSKPIIKKRCKDSATFEMLFVFRKSSLYG